MHVYPICATAAAVWGVLAGLAARRAAYRLAVEPERPWHEGCPAGHGYRAGWRGWLGPVPCPACATGGRGVGVVSVCAGACAALGALVGPRPELAVWLLLVPVGVVMGRVDLAVFRLPDVLTLPAVAGTAVLLGVAALLPGHGGSWTRALLGGLALLATYFLLFLVNPSGMGFGDVKLAPALGMALAWYGWDALFLGTFAGFALGAVAGLVLLALRRADRRTPIPFGPFMLIGALGGVLLAASA
jgi:leader peptidase (prepilin peptidase)/N-methyltransferase